MHFMEPDDGANSTTAMALSPEQVLGWIAASGDAPWFPSQYAEKTGIPREAFDEPLNELRTSELVRIADWIRGVGQGYLLTATGSAAVNGSPPAIAEPSQPASAKGDESKSGSNDLRFPLVTVILISANLIWYVTGLVAALRLGVSLKMYLLEGDTATFTNLGAVSSLDLLRGEWWRLGACCFVHGSIWHLLINLVNLGMVGALAEAMWKRWRVCLIYLISGFAGSCLAMGLSPIDSANGHPTMLVGASGAIWGSLAAVVAWLVLNHRELDRGDALELARRLGLGIAFSIAVSLLPGVSWQAHLGGAVAGFTTAVLLGIIRKARGPRRGLAILAVALLPALCAAGLLLAIKYSSRWEVLRRPPAPRTFTMTIPNPRLHWDAIQSAAIHRITREAAQFLLISPKNRKPERSAEVRGKVASIWSHAVEAAKLLEAPHSDPDGEERRVKEKAFADAIIGSTSLLLGMLDAKAIPTEAEWKSWGESQREADRLWREYASVPEKK
ncbi:MAG TPA: rhomboid family intramembrane serine protease [Urbifossiella sp.]